MHYFSPIFDDIGASINKLFLSELIAFIFNFVIFNKYLIAKGAILFEKFFYI